MRLEAKCAKHARCVERVLHPPCKLRLVACHEGDGNAEHLVRLRLQDASLFEQGEVRDRIRTHGQINRAHDRRLRIDGQRDMRTACRLDVEVSTKLGQMLRHIGA